MASFRLGVFFLGALMACKGTTRLEGTWRGTGVVGIEEGSAPMAEAFAKQMMIDVRGEQITVAVPGSRQSAKFFVSFEDKQQIVIVTDRDGPSFPQTFRFEANGTVVWAALEGKSIAFAKQ